jgi:hypothetical protein
VAARSRTAVHSEFFLLIDFEFFIFFYLELIGLGLDWNCWA